MKHARANLKPEFRVLTGNERSQAAEMTIKPGGHEGGSKNRHSGADQWLLVVSGSGEAIINGDSYNLEGGSTVLIEKGDLHEIRNTGDEPLKTLNIYLPPAYSPEGDELPPGKP